MKAKQKPIDRILALESRHVEHVSALRVHNANLIGRISALESQCRDQLCLIDDQTARVTELAAETAQFRAHLAALESQHQSMLDASGIDALVDVPTRHEIARAESEGMPPTRETSVDQPID